MAALGQKGEEIRIETIPLEPVYDVRRERGLLQEIIGRATQENRRDFVSVTLTDEKEPYHPREQLEEVYEHLLEINIDNTRTRNLLEIQEESCSFLSPMEAFRGFYQEMQGQPLGEEEERLIGEVLEELGGEQ